jgi:hypothetical protein
MKVGLLWFDDDTSRDLTEKIARAANHYRKKFGVPPDSCYVHKSALSDNGNAAKARLQVRGQVGQIQVKTLPSVLLHHFWVGREEKRNQGLEARRKESNVA